MQNTWTTGNRGWLSACLWCFPVCKVSIKNYKGFNFWAHHMRDTATSEMGLGIMKSHALSDLFGPRIVLTHFSSLVHNLWPRRYWSQVSCLYQWIWALRIVMLIVGANSHADNISQNPGNRLENIIKTVKFCQLKNIRIINAFSFLADIVLRQS